MSNLAITFGLLLLVGGCTAQAPEPSTCGNAICDPGETQANCCSDCGCPTGESCTANQCKSGGATCGDHICQPTESTTSCCTDCGCPTGQSCTANACVTPARCGDGICQPTESMDTCCTDCGCGVDGTCSGNICLEGGNSTLTWTISDGCDKGTMSMRFWDENDHAAWPSKTATYALENGQQATHSIKCFAGHNICLGAQVSDGTNWGVALDNSVTCTNCCFICATKSVSYSGPLMCP